MFLVGMMAWAIAQTVAQVPLIASSTVWRPDWQASHCTIDTGDPETISLSLWMTPGDPDPMLYIVGPPQALPRTIGDRATVTLLPSGETFHASVERMDGSRLHILRLFKLREKFPAAFSGSSELRLLTTQGSVSIRTEGSAQAMTALRECVDLKLSEWGVDTKALAALRSPPLDQEDYEWVTPDDYPMEALRDNKSGNVVARLDVDASGRVTGCSVVVTSGVASLDKKTCSLALKRARFRPAIGADRAPTAAVRVVNVGWVTGS